jgi:hypothetical protein
MDERLNNRLAHALKSFNMYGHKNIGQWEKEGDLYRCSCMNCGASVVIETNRDVPPQFIAQQSVKDKNGNTIYCATPVEFDRFSRLGHI